MKGTENLARFTWITYLITATPLVLFSVVLTLISIRFLFVEDIGPIEEPPLPAVQSIIFSSSAVLLPITWIFGITLAHRFNGLALRAFPFLANLLPMFGLFWFALILTRDEGGEFIWMAAYIGVLVALLATGIVAAMASGRHKPQAPNKAWVDNPLARRELEIEP